MLKIFRSIKEWASSAKAAEKGTKNQVPKEPTGKATAKVVRRPTSGSTRLAPKHKLAAKSANSRNSSELVMHLGNRRSDKMDRLSTTGDFGFFETELGTVLLHRNDIDDESPPIVGQEYSYQLGEGKDGKLKAYKASKARTTKSPEVQTEARDNSLEACLGERRVDKVRTVNAQGGFGILEGELGTVFLHRNDVDDKSLPIQGQSYAYTLEKRDDGKLKAVDASPEDRPTVDNTDDGVEPIHDLYKWAYIWLGTHSKFSPAIKQLADLALGEDWRYREQSDTTFDEFGVLRSYIRFTFTRISHEGKVAEDKKYAVFNTGLVDRLYQPIFALFQKNDDPDHPELQWKWKAFCVSGEGHDGKLLSRTFSTLPPAARYFEHIDDLYFDADAPFDEDVKHIVLDGIKRDRYPHNFLRDYAGEFSQEAYDSSPIIEVGHERLRKYLVELADKLNKDDAMFRKLHSRLLHAIVRAREKARWNYRAVVPQYYPRHNRMSFLLPLALVDLSDTIIDAALVVQAERVDGELKYQAYTIFPLSYAYRNARLVAKPISDWLNPEKILEKN